MKNTSIQTWRQGDILLVRVNEIPEGCKPMEKRNGSLVLAEGEQVNHFHEVLDESATGWLKGDDMYVDIAKKAKGPNLFHPDHNDPKKNKIPQILEKGKYMVIRQVEYRRQELKRVVD